MLTLLKSEPDAGAFYQSLIAGHELITADTVQNLIVQMDRHESLEAIHRLFDDRQFDKVFF